MANESSSVISKALDYFIGITVAPPLKKFHIRILIHFYINQGIAAIFQKKKYLNFLKINKRSPTFIPESKVLVFVFYTSIFSCKKTQVLNTKSNNYIRT